MRFIKDRESEDAIARPANPLALDMEEPQTIQE